MNKKYMLYVLAAVLIAVFLEVFVYNFHPLLCMDSQDVSFDVTGVAPGMKSSSETLGMTYTNQTTAALITFQEPVYIKKFQIYLDCENEQKYFMNVSYINAFGVEEEERLIDLCYEEFGTGITAVGKKVSSIRITYTEGAPVAITGFRMLNQFQMSGYRMVFFSMLVLFLLFLKNGKKNFREKPEQFVAAAVLCMGIFIISCQGVNENGWDEQVHFKEAYNLSYQNSIQRSNSYLLLADRIPENYYNTIEEKRMVENYLDEQHQIIEESPKETTVSISKTAYLIQAAAIFLARKLGLRFSLLYMAGKLANLLTYAFLMYQTVRIIPRKKWETAALALVPTQMFVASTYTYDVAVNGFIFLGTAMWLKVMTEEKGRNQFWWIAGSILAITVGALAKAVYIPLVLMCLIIPKEKFPSIWLYRILWGAIVAVFLAAMCGFIIPVMIATLQNATGQLTDGRIQGSDQVLQMQTVFRHLPSYLKMLFKDLLQMSGELITGHAGLANFGRLQELESGFSFITVAWFLVVMLGHQKREAFVLKRRYKYGLFLLCACVAVLIATSMYLAATAVGAESISGVQGRYFYPLFLPLLYICSNSRIGINIGKELYHKIILGTPVLLLFAGIYWNMLQGWCF